MNAEPLIGIAVIVAVFFCGILTLVFLVFGRLWIEAVASGVHVSIFELVGMALRHVPARLIVDVLVQMHKAGVVIPRSYLEAHYLASRSAGAENVSLLAKALVMAHQNGVVVPHSALGAHQLAGGDIEKVVMALIGAKHSGLQASFEQIAAHDVLGNDVLEVVKRGVEMGEIESPKPSRPEAGDGEWATSG